MNAWLIAAAIIAASAVLLAVALLGVRQVGARRGAAAPVVAPAPDRSALVARVAELEAQLPAVVRQIRELEESTDRRLRSLHGVLARERRGGQEAATAPAGAPALADDGSPVLTPALAAQLGIDLEAHAPVNEQRTGLGLPTLPPLPARRRFGGR